MRSSFGQLLRKGALDSLLQVAATTLVRLGLVVAVLGLAPFVSFEELGRFDLFVVGSSFAVLAVMIGMDSGLAIVANRQSQAIRRALLIVALCIVCILALVWSLLLVVVLVLLPSSVLEVDSHALIWMTLTHGALSGVLILIFSWFRWQGRATTASLILIAANGVGFAAATIAFTIEHSIPAFVAGLLLGAAFGIFGCFIFLIRAENFSRNDIAVLFRPQRAKRLAWSLLGVSLPYVMASVSLLLRRAIDRSYLMTLGDPVLLGAYAVVARGAELVGFAFSLPSVGFAPIFVARHGEASTRRLARIFYGSYVVSSFVVVSLVFVLTALMPNFLGSLLGSTTNANVNEVSKLLAPILVGTLFLGELSCAGFGYAIARRPKLYSQLSVAYPLLYLICVAGLASAGMGIDALGWAFAITSFLFVSIVIVGSESLVRFDYPIASLVLVKLVTLALALVAMELEG